MFGMGEVPNGHVDLEVRTDYGSEKSTGWYLLNFIHLQSPVKISKAGP